MSTNDYSHGYADGAGQAHEQRGEEIEAIRARVAELEKENTTIRALLVKYECPYGEKSLGECSRGFPGCACADDMLATASWCPEDEDKAAVRLGRRVAELEAELASIKRQCIIRRGHEREDLMAHGETVLCSTDLVARLYDDRITAEAHANALRDALVRWADANDAARRANLLLGMNDKDADREYREAGDALMRIARNPAHPAASLAAHDAEVGMRVVSECAMTMRSKCDCTHCDENAPGWEGRAIVERALAAQEVKRTEERWECPTCGLGVAADEDGCCAMCGADCKAQEVKP